MKRWIFLILLATPALAQDEPGDAGDDFFSLESMGNFEDLGPEFDPLLEVRRLLVQANAAPMDKKQEKDLKKVYDKEVKVVGKPFERRFNVPLKTAMGALQTPARGRRGGNSGRPLSAQAVEARRLAQQLVDKMIASLQIDQQGPLRRHQSEQARITKLNTLTRSMSLAGTPLMPEQVTEVETILARESRLRTLLIVEAKGGPYQAQILHLEAQTTERLLALMDPAQKLTYGAAMSSGTAPRTNPPASRGTR
jgi:hypothetical protein